MNLQEIRQQYPQYNDMSDEALADAVHAKYYSDLPKEQVYQKLGVGPLSGEETAASAMGALAKGIPLVGTYLDEAAAAGSAGVVDPLTGNDQGSFTDRYNKYLEQTNQMQDKFAQEHPVASRALPVGMGIYSAMSGVGGPLLNPVTPLGMAGSGALLSGAYESGDNPQDRVGAGILGAGTGAAIGYGVGKLLNAFAPSANTSADEFVNNYVANKQGALPDKVIAGRDLEQELRSALAERGGKSFGQNFSFPSEVSPYFTGQSDLYSLDTLRSKISDPDLKAAFTKIISDRVPVDFRADYSKAMQLEKLDSMVNAAGGDPLKMQTAMRNYAKQSGLPDEVSTAANKAGYEGTFKGLATGKTLPMLAYTLEQTPVLGGLVTGARQLAKERVLNDIDATRRAITGDEPIGLLSRAMRGMKKGLLK